MVSDDGDAAITVYHRLGYSQSEIVTSLLANHDTAVSERHTVARLCTFVHYLVKTERGKYYITIQ